MADSVERSSRVVSTHTARWPEIDDLIVHLAEASQVPIPEAAKKVDAEMSRLRRWIGSFDVIFHAGSRR